MKKPTPIFDEDETFSGDNQTDFFVVTVQTNPGDELDNWEYTAKGLGYNYKVLGLGEKWGGWNWRTKQYLEYVKTLPRNSTVLITDCNDVFFVKPATELYQSWMTFVTEGKRLVFGGESTCCTGEYRFYVSPSKRNEAIKKIKSYDPESRWMFPNAGCMIGFRDNVIEALEISKEAEDDQAAYLKEYLQDKDWLAIDYNHRMFGNINSLAFFYKMDFVPEDYYNSESKHWKVIDLYTKVTLTYRPFLTRGLQNTETNGIPAVLHFPGKNFVLYNYYGVELYGNRFKEVEFQDIRKALWGVSLLWK